MATRRGIDLAAPPDEVYAAITALDADGFAALMDDLEPRERVSDVLKIRPSDLRAIIAGDAGPRRLALRGRLRVLGDLKLGMRLSELFDLS